MTVYRSIKHIGLVVLLGIVIGIISTLLGNEILSLILVVLSIIGLIALLYSIKDFALRGILFFAYILRLCVIFAGTYIINLPDSNADGAMFENLAKEIVNAWILIKLLLRHQHYIYSKIIAIIYFIFGDAPILALTLNAILGVLSVYFTYKIILVLGGTEEQTRIGAIVAALFPTLNLYSAVLLRESIVTCSTVISVYYLLKWQRKGGIMFAFISSISLMFASLFHGAMIIVGIVHIICFVFYSPKTQKIRLFSRQMIFS